MQYRLLFLIAVGSVFVSACANSCGSEKSETKPEATTKSAVTPHEGGTGGSRFAKPFVPGTPPPALPARDE